VQLGNSLRVMIRAHFKKEWRQKAGQRLPPIGAGVTNVPPPIGAGVTNVPQCKTVVEQVKKL